MDPTKNKGLALLSIGLENYTQAITYFDKALALAVDPQWLSHE